jgi:D-threo-aldose 1-dehydrogenase
MDPTARRRLGGIDVELPVIGFGGAHLGELYARVPEPEARATLEAAWEGRVRYFDTAPWYGHGLSEHRTGELLRQHGREGFLVSTKVGRVYSRPRDLDRFSGTPWAGGLPFEHRFDYGYDGVMRAYEQSLLRLGLARVDVLLIHDLDAGYHGEEGVRDRLRELDEGGGLKALAELKAAGEIGAFGAGVNDATMIRRFLDLADLDLFLVAMPYTLLDQPALDEAFPLCAKRNVGVVIGAPFASGILASGAVSGAKYGYAVAPEALVEKVRRLEAACGRHGVPLAAAALQFPLHHPLVASVIPGAVSPGQVRQNLELTRVEIPADLWAELKAEGLLRADAPAA